MPLLREKRSVTYAIVVGIWLQVFLYCLLHDQYLIRIAPEHFTVYHAPLWGITDLTLLAAAWAFRASVGPGLGLGLVALFVARAGSRPKVAPKRLLKVVPWLLLVTEAAGLATGAWVWKSGRPLYPEIVYPEFTLPLMITQTIQLTCYGVGMLVSLGYLIWIARVRCREAGFTAG
ncbi:hypothetical protein OKA04_06455 [Luteolibacter flavescens]|uniref:Uncharacterized protein n=1 Tax=Luteolibacter flavescens TaxID=1859460 RepID=A0ABT3FL97_9BACT|nr:hypothetical protein [Luteolibacter flavescens]MCW1884366.1 hypothetical protein [Luteolibacter flavescens]